MERDELQRRAAEQAAMLTQHGSQEKALEASALSAQQDAARLRLDLQAAEHQHAQQLVSASISTWKRGCGARSNSWPVESVGWDAASASECTANTWIPTLK